MKGKLVAVTMLLIAWSSGQAGFVASGTDTRQILIEQRQILEEVENPTGKYSRFSDQAQHKLKAAQAKIFALLDGGRTLDQLGKDEQVELLNSVEEIKAIIANNQKDKLECWREPKLGTNLKVTRCETVATRERLREEARLWKSGVGACQMGESGAAACGPPDVAPSSRGY